MALGLFAVAYGTNVSTPFLVLYRERLGLNDSETVGIFVAYVAGILATLVVIGPISDRIGRRPVVLPFIGLAAVASLLLLLGRDSFGLLLVGRCLLGVVSGGVLGVGSAWLQELMGRGAEQQAAVLTTAVTYLGFGAGPLVSAVLASAAPAPLVTPFVVHIVLVVVVLPWVLRVPDVSRDATNPPRPFRVEFGVPAAARTTFVGLVVPTAIWVFAFASVSFAVFPVLLSDAIGGSDVLVAGAVGTITAGSGLFARPLVNRIGPEPVLPLSVALGVVGNVLGLVAIRTDYWPLILPAALLLGTASGALTAGGLTVLGSLADDDRRGAATSTFYLLAYPGMAMPLVVTTVAAATSVTTALVAESVVALGCVAVASRFVFGRKPRRSVRIDGSRSS